MNDIRLAGLSRRLDRERNTWHADLTAEGHTMTWTLVGEIAPGNVKTTHYAGECTTCGGRLNVGEYWEDIVNGAPSLTNLTEPIECPGSKR